MKDIQPDRAMIKSQTYAIDMPVSHDPLAVPVYEARIEEMDCDITNACSFSFSMGLTSGGDSLTSTPVDGSPPGADKHYDWHTTTTHYRCSSAAAERFTLFFGCVTWSFAHGIAARRGEPTRRHLKSMEVTHV